MQAAPDRLNRGSFLEPTRLHQSDQPAPIMCAGYMVTDNNVNGDPSRQATLQARWKSGQAAPGKEETAEQAL